jgi:hypothetical protein
MDMVWILLETKGEQELSKPEESKDKVFVVVKFWGGGGAYYEELKAFKSKDIADKFSIDNEGEYHYYVEELDLN